MMLRLTSIKGSKEAPPRVTSREYLATQRESETIWVRNSLGSLLASSRQSEASALHNCRFQSMASISGAPLAAILCASSKAPVTWPNRRYSVLRGLSTVTCVFPYALWVMAQPLLLEFEQCLALQQRLVIGAAHHILGDLDAGGERVAIADRAHEFAHAQRELVVIGVIGFAIEIHHHDGEIDALRRRVGLVGLDDVLLAQ